MRDNGFARHERHKSDPYIVGPTKGHEADAGSIRGDLSMGVATNIVHASDSPFAAEAEINRFFNENEIFEYDKIDEGFIFGE